MSPQDAMMHLKNMHNGAGAGGDPFKEGPYPKGKNPLSVKWWGQIWNVVLRVKKSNCCFDLNFIQFDKTHLHSVKIWQFSFIQILREINF